MAGRRSIREAAITRARTTVAETGVRSLTLRGLAADLGVTPAALSHLFGSRGGLVAQLSLRVHHELIDRIFEQPITSPASVLLEYLRVHPNHHDLLLEGRRPSADITLIKAQERLTALLVPEAVPNFHYQSRTSAVHAWALAEGLALLNTSLEQGNADSPDSPAWSLQQLREQLKQMRGSPTPADPKCADPQLDLR